MLSKLIEFWKAQVSVDNFNDMDTAAFIAGNGARTIYDDVAAANWRVEYDLRDLFAT